MAFKTLPEWLAWQQTLHPNAIDLGLDRIRRTLERLGWRQPSCPVITVAGTNGKGSTAAFLCSRPASYVTGSIIRCDGGAAHSV